MSFLIAHLDPPRWFGDLYDTHADAEAALHDINHRRKAHSMPAARLYRITEVEER